MWEVGANDQIFKASDYAPLIVAYHNGAPVRISDIGEAVDSVQDVRNAGYANGKPSVLVIILPPARRQYHRHGGPRARRAAAASRRHSGGHRHAAWRMDQTVTIRASVRDVERVAGDLGGAGGAGGVLLSCATRAPPSFPASRFRFR